MVNVGSSPNANGGGISAGVITLQPADGTNPGLVTTGSQTIAGVKTFSSAPNLSSLTASLPLKLDASKNVTSAAIALGGSEVTGTLPEAKGGTNQSTYTTGDTLYASAANTLSKRAIGSNGDVYTVSGGVPIWAAPSAPTVIYKTTFSGTSITSGGATYPIQVFYYNGGSAQVFTGFGTLSGNYLDGAEITIICSSDTNTLTISESDAADGYLMNGSFVCGRGNSIKFMYDTNLARMVETSRSY